ncbi:MAG: dihydrolipoamide acetyltransferase family protein [Gemmatimonadaceae bacterium]
MATKVFMEALSPTMEEGRLVKWLKKEGDEISSGDPIAEVETDKAVMELVARGDGVLRKQIVGEGESRPVGELVGVIASADEDIGELVAGGGGGGGAAGGDEGAEKTKPAVKSGKTRAGKAGAEEEEDGAAPATTGAEEEVADADGEIEAPEIGEPEGDEAEKTPPPAAGKAASKPAGKAAPAPGTRAPAAPGGAAPTRPPAGGEDGERARSSPLARRLASERGVDLGNVEGSGPGGRIIKRDIEAAASAPKGDGARARQADSAGTGADYEDVPLSQMRKTIARRLVESIGPIPTFYLTAEFDADRMAEAREAITELGEEFRISVNDIIMKAVASALAQHPECNAHWLGDRIRRFNRVHLGVAVAIDEGLITPVIFDADTKSLREISGETRDLAKRARERKLKPDEYTGATFTVSNLGMFGIDQFTAIINPPEAGILAIGAIQEAPVVSGDELEVRKRIRVTMSCDHRVIDGATGAKFLQTLRRMIENPLMLVY